MTNPTLLFVCQHFLGAVHGVSALVGDRGDVAITALHLLPPLAQPACGGACNLMPTGSGWEKPHEGMLRGSHHCHTAAAGPHSHSQSCVTLGEHWWAFPLLPGAVSVPRALVPSWGMLVAVVLSCHPKQLLLTRCRAARDDICLLAWTRSELREGFGEPSAGPGNGTLITCVTSPGT